MGRCGNCGADTNRLILVAQSKGAVVLRSRQYSNTVNPSLVLRHSPPRRRLGRRNWWVWLLAFGLFAFFHDFGIPQVRTAIAQGSPESVTERQSDEALVEEDADGEQAGANHEEHGHSDPIAPILLAIVLILLLAKIAGDLFERIGMPAVLGELVVGIILGNFYFMSGWDGLEFLKAPPEDKLPAVLMKLNKEGVSQLTVDDRRVLAESGTRSYEVKEIIEKVERFGADSLTEAEHDVLNLAAQRTPYHTGAILKMLAGIGVILLLFEVGLESTVRQMMSVGVSSMLVALLGVIVPMLLGYGVSRWMLTGPEHGWQVHVFIGATLCATSVGITARVLKDIGRSQCREAQIILGAAVIDDVLGLIILAIVAGVIQQGTVEPKSLLLIVAKAFGFLFGAILVGQVVITRPLFKAATFLRGHGLLVATALVICFGFSWLANFFGLAPIVGAFAAGLILEEAHYRELGEREQHHQLEEALAPLTGMLVPIFFVQMGIQVDLAAFNDPSVWRFATAITVMAIIGKQVCAFGVREPGLNKLAVGLGMIPRGEVGLIFADVGRNLSVGGEPVIDPATFSAVVVMVMVTTMVTPPLLKWSMFRDNSKDASDESATGL